MKDSLHICFGTMTGNAETLAQSAEERAQADGWTTHLLNLCDVKPTDLRDLRQVLFVVSTWGDGEPPDDAADFWYGLEDTALDLSHLTFAVFGLGDQDYDDFNGFGRRLDERLAVLGASRLHDRFDADLDFEDTFPGWADAVLAQLDSRRGNAPASA
ncbi:flavodoxin domain-containing protein [Synoicihabitans lomoniglobus]|uniref:Flavodoxin domain-containing protein n=1 Tax=Synoicihabitans lomoniglobus TaxID=2909285 RepID=A0AAF0CNG6_9BACT|nr:flavodoxin domain-containing protein [Opitutaceae bacterium LMO-M01]WED65493.1 flavodoxin domain-containing protein [Opitutaceae bacterium LMO-M01]